MNKEYVSKCSEYFHYHYDINKSVSAVCFSWDEFEDIDFQAVSKFVDTANNKKNIYFFNNINFIYPIGFIDKHLGLWKRMEKSGLHCYSNTEEFISFNRYCTFCGISQIDMAQVELALELLVSYSLRDAYILFSDDEFDNLNSYKNYINMSESEMKVSIEKLINTECEKGNTVVTAIKGFNGTSINFFTCDNLRP